MKLITTALFTALLLTGCSNAGLFFVNNLARFGDYTAHTNIRYGPKEKQKLDLYLPENIAQSNLHKTPTVIFFYGGCWGACSDLNKKDYRFVAQALTANNIAVAIVDYRKFPDVLFSDIMSDAKHAVEWVSQNIASYGGDAHNLFLMGHSAGAHLASMLNFNETYLQPSVYKNIKGFIGLAGPYDFLPFDEPYQPALFAPPEAYAQSQTINFVDGTEPPALLLYGTDDDRVKRRNIVSLSNIINSKKGRVVTHYYPSIDHTGIISAFSIPLRASKPVVKDILSFIAQQKV